MALCSGLSETSQTLDTVWNIATVDDPGVILLSQPLVYSDSMNCILTKLAVMDISYGVVKVISAWALALSVQQYRAMRRPQRVGQTTGSSHASFYMFVLIINHISLQMGT